jgi:type IV secretory pathway VirB6-like protein
MKENNSYLKKVGGSKKDKEIEKYKRRVKVLIMISVILGVFLLVQISQNILKDIKKSSTMVITKSVVNTSLLNGSGWDGGGERCPEPPLTSSITKLITIFFNKIFESPGGFWVKFFIFLGIIYIVQVVFSLTFDVIELILLVFVTIKRLIMWIYYKITGKNKQDEQIKKILELRIKK